MLRDDKAEEFLSGDPEHKLLWVELDVVGTKVREGFLQAADQLCNRSRLDDDCNILMGQSGPN